MDAGHVVDIVGRLDECRECFVWFGSPGLGATGGVAVVLGEGGGEGEDLDTHDG